MTCLVELGEPEGEDDEVHAAQPEGREPDDQRDEEPDDRRRGERDRHRHHVVQDREAVDADAEERGSRQRDVAGGAGEERPGGRERDVGEEQTMQSDSM